MVNERAAASGEESVDFVGTNRLFGDILKYTGRSSRSGPVRSLPIRQSVNGSSQRGRVCARPDPAGAGGVGRKNIVQVNVGANQVSWLPKSGSPWAGEKSVLHKLRFHPDFVAPFPPLAKGGVRGGGPGTTSHKVFPCSLPLSRFASLSRGEKNRFRFPRLPHHPPCPPLRKGGKGIARSQPHSIARNKNTRLETVPPARATPTFHRPRVAPSALSADLAAGWGKTPRNGVEKAVFWGNMLRGS